MCNIDSLMTPPMQDRFEIAAPQIRLFPVIVRTPSFSATR